MEIALTRAQAAALGKIAEREGLTVTDLLTDAASTIIQIEEHRWEAIDRALAQADRGEFVDDDEMERRVARMLGGA